MVVFGFNLGDDVEDDDDGGVDGDDDSLFFELTSDDVDMDDNEGDDSDENVSGCDCDDCSGGFVGGRSIVLTNPVIGSM